MGRQKSKYASTVFCDCGIEACASPTTAERFTSYSQRAVFRKQAVSLGWRVRRDGGENWFAKGHIAAWEWVTEACMCKGLKQNGEPVCTEVHRSAAKPLRRKVEMLKAKWTRVTAGKHDRKVHLLGGVIGKLWIAPGHVPAWKQAAVAA